MRDMVAGRIAGKPMTIKGSSRTRVPWRSPRHPRGGRRSRNGSAEECNGNTEMRSGNTLLNVAGAPPYSSKRLHEVACRPGARVSALPVLLHGLLLPRPRLSGRHCDEEAALESLQAALGEQSRLDQAAELSGQAHDRAHDRVQPPLSGLLLRSG